VAVAKNLKIVVVKIDTPWRLTLGLITLFTLGHLYLADVLALGVDEAHYALYGKYLALSYFDHPPMVGWLQSFILPFSQSDFSLRLIPIFLFFLSALTLHSLTKQLYPNNNKYTPFVAVLLLLFSVLIHIISFAMIPEIPLLLFSLLVIKYTHHALNFNKKHHWVFLGIFLGLAGLSKYTAVILIIPILILVFQKMRENRSFPIGILISALIALILIMPVLLWNYQNNWLSFTYQMNHGTGGAWDLGLVFKSFIIQLLAFSPLIVIGSIVAIIKTKNHFLTLWFIPNIALFIFSSGFEFTLPHWTTLAWVSILPLLATYIPKLWQKIWGKILILFSSFLSLILVITLYLSIIDKLPFTITPHPLKDVTGWAESAKYGQELLQKLTKKYQIKNPTLFVTNWTHASRIAWYAYPTPVEVLDNNINQFDLWKPNTSQAGLLINLKKTTPSDFKKCQLLDDKKYKNINHFYFYWCQK
jgi:4-amino-4-deoxy-L-arabinose transferase-like glycosyltransferase